MRLYRWTPWRRTSLFRRSDFRVVDETPTRIVIRTRNRGLLAGGGAFVLFAVGIAWVGFSRSAGRPGELALVLGLAGLFALFGFAVLWASRTQRDTIAVDRELGTIRSERALKRRRSSDPPFRVEELPLAELLSVGIRSGSVDARLSFRFRGGRDLDVDRATDIEQLRRLGARLAATAGVELEQR